jgi:hypothetical protein
MQFVEFQDKLASENLSDKKINESSLLEKKISIMEKAVDSNPGSIELKMKYLDLCKGTMSPETITKEMEQLLFIHPTNMLLWKQYLLYHQSCVSIFTVSTASIHQYRVDFLWFFCCIQQQFGTS